MKPGKCLIERCPNPPLHRGWCGSHYKRWRRHGDPLGGGQRYKTPEEAFAARTERRGDCLVWTGSKDGHGYGNISVKGRMIHIHRYAWMRVHGPIPDGMVVDHTCFNSLCAEVRHLRLATKSQNGQYRGGADRGRKNGLPRGVTTQKGKYRAGATLLGEHYAFGTYSTVEEAERAAEAGRRKLFGEFAGLGVSRNTTTMKESA